MLRTSGWGESRSSSAWRRRRCQEIATRPFQLVTGTAVDAALRSAARVGAPTCRRSSTGTWTGRSRSTTDDHPHPEAGRDQQRGFDLMHAGESIRAVVRLLMRRSARRRRGSSSAAALPAANALAAEPQAPLLLRRRGHATRCRPSSLDQGRPQRSRGGLEICPSDETAQQAIGRVHRRPHRRHGDAWRSATTVVFLPPGQARPTPAAASTGRSTRSSRPTTARC